MLQYRTDQCRPYSFATLVATVLLALLFAGAGALVESPLFGHQVALADDDDGGDDDGGDDGDSDDGGTDDSGTDDDGMDDDEGSFGSGGTSPSGQNSGPLSNPLPTQNQAPRRQQQSAPAPLPTRAPDEVVAVGLSDDDVDALIARGYAVIERSALQQLTGSIVRLRVPSGTSLEDARAEIGNLSTEAATELNHFYRTSATAEASGEPDTAGPCEGLGCAEKQLINWPSGAGTVCGADARIGLIDTGINPDHETFEGRQLEVMPISQEDAQPSERKHGTAVAAILLGSPESRSPGLLPNATVIAVDAFYRAPGADIRSDAYTLVRAMDRLAERGVTIMNLSFSGPDNALLEAMVKRLAESGTVLIAAAGNSGPTAEPAFPAAYSDVIAVTAVSRDKTVYRRAGRGDHIDLAAPGVEVWTAASIRGARPKTGTSFAVPFVTATVALLEHQMGITGRDAIIDALAARALDLGEPGKDPVYGFGLLQASGLCDAADAARQSG